jgi:hypothetical protein
LLEESIFPGFCSPVSWEYAKEVVKNKNTCEIVDLLGLDFLVFIFLELNKNLTNLKFRNDLIFYTSD